MNYPIGDFLIRIKNAYRAYKKELSFPYVKTAFSISKILEEEGYIKKTKETNIENKRGITLELSYKGRRPALQNVTIVSKPSVHEYFDVKAIRKENIGQGITIVSTNKGIMTTKKAQKENVGGEIICRIY